jgi:acyl-CoA synthetase (AMP-forming)/AMP-acid ligase II
MFTGDDAQQPGGHRDPGPGAGSPPTATAWGCRRSFAGAMAWAFKPVTGCLFQSVSVPPEDVLVQALPLVHLYRATSSWAACSWPTPRWWCSPPSIRPASRNSWPRNAATACAGMPTTYAMLCQLPEQQASSLDLSWLAVALSVGAPLPGSIRTGFQRLFGPDVLDCYGITEAAGNLVASPRYGERPDLSCGVPYPLTEVRIVDPDDNDVPPGEVGELIARGPQIMTGYWGRPDATAETLRGGWLHTGELARRDANGLLLHRGPHQGPDPVRRVQRVSGQGGGGRDGTGPGWRVEHTVGHGRYARTKLASGPQQLAGTDARRVRAVDRSRDLGRMWLPCEAARWLQ